MQWKNWIEVNGLQANRWLREMYNLRFRWCPSYMTDYFFTGMSTTQRSEKMKIKSHFTLLEFIWNYETVFYFYEGKGETIGS